MVAYMVALVWRTWWRICGVYICGVGNDLTEGVYMWRVWLVYVACICGVCVWRRCVVHGGVCVWARDSEEVAECVACRWWVCGRGGGVVCDVVASCV